MGIYSVKGIVRKKKVQHDCSGIMASIAELTLTLTSRGDMVCYGYS